MKNQRVMIETTVRLLRVCVRGWKGNLQDTKTLLIPGRARAMRPVNREICRQFDLQIKQADECIAWLNSLTEEVDDAGKDATKRSQGVEA